MKKRHYKCDNCGAELIIDADAESGTCEYCGTVYYIDKQKPAKVYHYFENVKITPAKIALILVVIALLAAAITIIALYFSGVFGDKTPPISEKFEHKKAYLYEGTYLVGEDMEAGEFVAFKDPSKERGRILILTDKDGLAGTSACLEDYRFANNCYFTVKQGVYVKAEDCNIFRIGDKTVESMPDGSYEGNLTLRGGADIPAGNYVLTNQNSSLQYAKIKCVIGGKEYEKQIGFRTHLTISEGDYIYLTIGKLFAEENAPSPTLGDDGEYLQGQYKVGVDIPAGRYKLNYGNAGNVAYFVKNSFAFFDKEESLPPYTTSGYIDLQDGEYIYLYMIRLVPQDTAQ